MAVDGVRWAAVENPKATTLALLFALTLTLGAFGVVIDYTGGGSLAGPVVGSHGP